MSAIGPEKANEFTAGADQSAMSTPIVNRRDSYSN